MAKLKRQTKECLGCGDPFITYRHYDYCPNCAINGNRYLSKSNCSECDGSGIIKFRHQKPRPCKLCALTKNSMTNKKLTAEQAEQQFWEAVEKKSKSLIADLIENVLPISAIPSVFDLEKDTDYRLLLRDDLPQSYTELEEYQTKIANQSWTQTDVDYVAQDLTCAYFDLVVKALVENLTEYPAFDNTHLAAKFYQ